MFRLVPDPSMRDTDGEAVLALRVPDVGANMEPVPGSSEVVWALPLSSTQPPGSMDVGSLCKGSGASLPLTFSMVSLDPSPWEGDSSGRRKALGTGWNLGAGS